MNCNNCGTPNDLSQLIVIQVVDGSGIAIRWRAIKRVAHQCVLLGMPCYSRFFFEYHDLAKQKQQYADLDQGQNG